MDDTSPKRRWRGPGLTKANTSGRSDDQPEHVRDKKKSESSRNWLQRQLDDPYVKRTKAEGLRARSAFKLRELDERFGLIRRGARVVDLGAAPGGWTQVAIDRGSGPVVGIDLLPIEPIPGAVFFEMDFLDEGAAEKLMAALGGAPDLVLSDMAANTIGHQRTDHLRTVALLEAAVAFAVEHLAPGGAFCGKVFQGGADGDVLKALKTHFREVKHAKPPASRQESPEMYVIGKGFRR